MADIMGIIKRSFFVKPELQYLETHLADHCNLNCKGCGHFCPISPERFVNIEAFRRDMMRLKELFSNIKLVRLMGGEPLLHEQVTDFLTISREAFPRSHIRLVTNGILLPHMSEDFWQTCADQGIVIHISHYPIKIDIDSIKALILRYGLRLVIGECIINFSKMHMNLQGNSNRDTAFRACRKRFYCPFLDDGRLYVCGIPALIHYLNKQFKEDMTVCEEDYISIHDNVTARKVLDFLNSPAPFCRYCSTTVTDFEWSISKREREEWLD